MSKRRNLVVLLVLAMLAALLAACAPVASTAGSAAEGQTVVQIAHWFFNHGDSFEGWINPVVDDFEKANPNIKVERLSVPYDTYWSKLDSELAAGSAPDIVATGDNNLGKYIENGAFLALNDLIDMDEITNNFSILQNETVPGKAADGKTYMVISDVVSYMLLYRPSMLQDAGIAGFPKTPDEFIEAAKKMKTATGKSFYNMVTQPGDYINGSTDIRMWSVAFGAKLSDGKGNPVLNSPEMLKVFTFLNDLYKADIMVKDAPRDQFKQLMANGDVACIFDGAYSYPLFVGWNGDFGMDLDATYYPGDGDIPCAFEGLSVTAKSKSSQAAASLIMALCGKEQQKKMVEQTLVLTARTDVSDDKAFMDSINSKYPFLPEYLERANNTKTSIPTDLDASKIDEFLRILHTSFERMLYDNVAPADALLQAQTEADILFK